MTFSRWQAPAFITGEIQTDILIVGGGFVGLSTAYWLSELDPTLKITIIERRFCGEGASGRNAGFLTKGSSHFYKNLSEKWDEEKALSIITYANKSLSLLSEHILCKDNSLTSEPTTSMTLLREQPSTLTIETLGKFGFNWRTDQQHVLGGFEQADTEYKINPLELLGSLKKTLLKRGVKILENTSGLKLTDHGCVTDSNSIVCHKVVLALNGYSAQFHPVFKDFIFPRQAQMMAVQLGQKLNASHLYYDPEHLVYWRTTDENMLLIGGKRSLDPLGEVGTYDRTTPMIQNALEEYLRSNLQLKFQVIQRWAGTMGFTECELPILTKVDSPVETLVVGGFSGHGMGFGFHAALEAAEILTHKKSSSFFQDFHQPKISL